jgi:hypothetical protein
MSRTQPKKGGENNQDLNTANTSSGVGTTLIEVRGTHMPVSATADSDIGSEIPSPDESGWSKRKRVPQQLADALNGCLCGLVLDGLLGGVLKCKQAGCETQWVSTFKFFHRHSDSHMCLVPYPMRRT